MFGFGKGKEKAEVAGAVTQAKPISPPKPQRYIRVREVSRTKINYDFEAKMSFAAKFNFILSLIIAVNVLIIVKNVVKTPIEANLIIQARDAAWIMEELTLVGKPGLLSAEKLAERVNTIGYVTEIGLDGNVNYGLDDDLLQKAALEEKDRAREALRNSKIILMN